MEVEVIAYGKSKTDSSIFSLRMPKLNELVLVYLQEGPTYYNQGHPLDIVLIAALEAVKTNHRDHCTLNKYLSLQIIKCRCVCACVSCMCNPTLLGPNAPFFKFLLELDSPAGSVLPSAVDSTRTTIH